jgi:phosphate transport system substrate-binding protein
MKRRRRLGALLAVVGVLFAVASPAAQAAPSHAQITGSGSSWASNAVNQWIADVNKQGLQVVFTAGGSAQGRKDYAYKTTDFGVSDIPYQGHDSVTGAQDDSLGRPYAYLPIVAGGTSFPYHIGNGTNQIRNLRLSGLTLAKIFTNQITNWNDPAIAADNNNQLTLPNLRITPVVHSEGSGSTAQFTLYMAKQFPSIWGAYNGSATLTEYFPRKGSQVAQNGSDGVMNFITSAAGNGTIGFDEYSYALLANYPVAKMLNAAGFYTAPTQYNDAVALTAAQINNDPTSVNYLTQNLDAVYTNPAPQTYPLSSYSYMIIPTGANGVEQKTNTTAQRQTISDFLYYSICQGQSEMGPIGYSPLPVNLVTAGFSQIAKLKLADPNVDLSARDVTTCNNPTFVLGHPAENHLADIAPLPPACDKQGAGPCAATVGLTNANPGSNGAAPTTAAAKTTGAAAPGITTAATAGAVASSSSAGGVDPLTGQTSGASGDGGAGNVVGVSSELASSAKSQGFNTTLYVLAVGLLLVLLLGPVLIGRYFSAREGRRV